MDHFITTHCYQQQNQNVSFSCEILSSNFRYTFALSNNNDVILDVADTLLFIYIFRNIFSEHIFGTYFYMFDFHIAACLYMYTFTEQVPKVNLHNCEQTL